MFCLDIASTHGIIKAEYGHRDNRLSDSRHFFHTRVKTGMNIIGKLQGNVAYTEQKRNSGACLRCGSLSASRTRSESASLQTNNAMGNSPSHYLFVDIGIVYYFTVIVWMFSVPVTENVTLLASPLHVPLSKLPLSALIVLTL